MRLMIWVLTNDPDYFDFDRTALSRPDWQEWEPGAVVHVESDYVLDQEGLTIDGKCYSAQQVYLGEAPQDKVRILWAMEEEKGGKSRVNLTSKDGAKLDFGIAVLPDGLDQIARFFADHGDMEVFFTAGDDVITTDETKETKEMVLQAKLTDHGAFDGFVIYVPPKEG